MQHNETATSEGIEHLQLSVSDYNKYKIGKNELSIEGRLYDIKTATVTGSHVELLVLNDVREKNIIDDIAKTLMQHNSQNRKLPQPLIQMLAMEYILPESGTIAHPVYSKQTSYNLYKNIIFSCNKMSVSPPPKFV